MKLRYRARDQQGVTVAGIRDAKDRFDLAHLLRKEGLSIVAARADKKTWQEYLESINESFVTIPRKEKINFAHNLGSMLKAGLPLSRALSIIERQTKNRKLKQITTSIIQDISAGASLHDALEKYERVFSSVFVAMVGAGEQSGNLPEALNLVALQMEKTYMIERKVTGALLYPAVIMFIMLIISMLMLVYVVPTLTRTFVQMKVELPLSTQFIVGSSSLLVNHYLIFFGVVLGMIALGYWFFSHKIGKALFERCVRALPVIGSLLKESYSAQIARTLSALIASGVDVVAALETTKGVVTSRAYQAALAEAQAGVQKGKSLAETFQHHDELFPILLGEMIEVGEETGEVANMLEQTASFYEEEIDAATKDLSTVIEPLLMVLIGGGVGFFAISIIQPIYSISNAIS